MSAFPNNTPYVSVGKTGLVPVITFKPRMYDVVVPFQTNQAGSVNLILPEGAAVSLDTDNEVILHTGAKPVLGIVVVSNDTSKYTDEVTSPVRYPIYQGKEKEVMVELSGTFVVRCVAAGAVARGALVVGNGDVYSTNRDYQRVKAHTNEAYPLGVAKNTAAAAGDIIEVIIKAGTWSA
jgi:hypothetical protein